MTVAESGTSVRAVPAAAWGLALAAVIAAAFVANGLGAPLWFDEANYLSLADGIGRTGYPVWYWQPDRPELFGDSPPGFIYVIHWFSALISADIAVLRLFYGVTFGVIPWIAMIVVACRRGVALSGLAIAALFGATTGIWLLDLVQVRLDLPVAGLTAGAMILASGWIDAEAPSVRGRWTLAGIAVFSAAAFLVKYEAVCLTGALILAAAADALWLRNKRTIVVLAAHLTGLAGGLAILAVWTASYRTGGDAVGVADALQSNLFGRILPDLSNAGFEVETFRWTVKMMLPVAALPLLALIVAAVRGAVDWRGDPLLRLSTFFSLAVLGFNVAVYRLPGAGDYYMVEAVLPLGYILGRSLEALVPSGWPLVATAAAALAISFGLNSPSNLPSFVRNTDEPVAAMLAPVLAGTDILLLGDTSQSRAIPYLMGRSDRYGYLFHIDPAAAPGLLARRGPGQVGAIVLSPHAIDRLHAPEAAAILAAVDANFQTSAPLSPQGLTIYLRR